MKLTTKDLRFRKRFGEMITDHVESTCSLQCFCKAFPRSVPMLQKMDHVFNGEIGNFIAKEIQKNRSSVFGEFVLYEMPSPPSTSTCVSSRAKIATYLSAVLRAAMEVRGMTHTECGKAIGVNRVTWYRWCVGTSLPRRLQHIAALDELTGGVLVESLMTYGERAQGLLVTEDELKEFRESLRLT
jgi:hypothetical protein